MKLGSARIENIEPTRVKNGVKFYTFVGERRNENMTKTNELNALLKKMIGKPMTKEQREELERLKNKSNVVYG
jgi:hypothetical protein